MACEPWPVTWTCPVDGIDPEFLDLAVASAADLLWAMSGRRLGLCDYTEDYWPPCTGVCGAPYKDASGAWRNGGGRPATCCQILLDHRPISTVTDVQVHGVSWAEQIPPRYSWSDSYLRSNCECWPCLDPCCDQPIRVTYTAGVPFPVGTDLAVGEVACEILQGLQGNVCKLPSRATSVSRQGVTVELGAVEGTMLGLPLADAWLRVVNPSGLQSASRVYSPDLAASR